MSDDGSGDEAPPRPPPQSQNADTMLMSPGAKAANKLTPDAEIRKLLSKCNQRMASVRTMVDENSGHLKNLRDEFRNLKKQMTQLSREQQASLSALESGLPS
mmetsp:Transcript_140998/g.316143  ORF Transcript_140998/g.316143 Transcript_140998/m.316143 type:complete len:102 (+) Transcript_140998:39-344(+)